MSKKVSQDLRTETGPLLQEFASRFKQYQNSTVNVVGAGFVGTWCTELLCALNDLFDYKIKIHVTTLSGKHLNAWAPHLLARKDVKLTIQDCRRITFTSDTNYILHAASPVNPQLQQFQPLSVTSVVADGVSACFEAARILPDLKNIVYLSSGAVYGSQPFETGNLSENDFLPSDPSSLSNVYAESKRFAEAVCVAHRNESRLPIVIARPFAFLGPYQLSSTPWALHNFIADGMSGRPIRVFGDGQSVRSYLYGSDAALWILTLLVNAKSGSVYNLGNSQGVSLAEAAKIVSNCFDHKVEINFMSQGAHLKKTRFVPSTEKIQKEFDLKVYTSLETAIRKTIQWMTANQSGE